MRQKDELIIWWLWVVVICMCVSCSSQSPVAPPRTLVVFRRHLLENEADSTSFERSALIANPLAALDTQSGELAELPDFPVYALDVRVIKMAGLSWSPNGRHVVYVTWDDAGANREIYRADPDGSNVVNLTNHPSGDEEPVWSPDGQYIAFLSGRNTCATDIDPIAEQRDDPMAWCGRLHVMKPDGSDLRQLPLPDRAPVCFDWSPDSQYLVVQQGYAEYAPEFPINLYVVSRDGGEVRELLDLKSIPDPLAITSNLCPDWSPRGDYLDLDVQGTIYLVHPDGSGLRRIWPPVEDADRWRIDRGLVWSPDGKYLAGFFRGEIGLFIIEVESGSVAPLGHAELLLHLRQPLVWHPDGRHLVFQGYSGAGKYDIYSVNIESGELVNLTAQYPESFTLINEWIIRSP
jgi:Tol biopolymer transport system component